MANFWILALFALAFAISFTTINGECIDCNGICDRTYESNVSEGRKKFALKKNSSLNCADGFCVCQEGFAGPYCNISSTLIPNGQTIRQFIARGDGNLTTFHTFVTLGTHLLVEVTQQQGEHVDVYVNPSSAPTATEWYMAGSYVN
jgi:hypothetical protein